MSLPSKKHPKTSKNMFANDRHQVCERGEWVSSKLVSAYDFGPKTGDGAVRVLPRVRSDPPLAYSWVSVHQKWNMHKTKRGNFRGWSGLKNDMDRVKIYGFGTCNLAVSENDPQPTGGQAQPRWQKSQQGRVDVLETRGSRAWSSLAWDWLWSGQKHWRSSIHRG